MKSFLLFFLHPKTQRADKEAGGHVDDDHVQNGQGAVKDDKNCRRNPDKTDDAGSGGVGDKAENIFHEFKHAAA